MSFIRDMARSIRRYRIKKRKLKGIREAREQAKRMLELEEKKRRNLEKALAHKRLRMKEQILKDKAAKNMLIATGIMGGTGALGGAYYLGKRNSG